MENVPIMNKTTTTPDTARTRRGRLILLAIVALFALPILAAFLINLAERNPPATRQHGQLLQPPLDLRAQTLPLADGGRYAWQPRERQWRLLVVPSAQRVEGQDLADVARDITLVWRLLGRHADRVDVLWLGASAPADLLPGTLRVLRENPALRSALSTASLPVDRDAGAATATGPWLYVIDPNGFVVLRYPPGFDPAGLRSDLARLVKLQ